jgi:hypothetical protein
METLKKAPPLGIHPGFSHRWSNATMGFEERGGLSCIYSS